MFKMIWK